MDEIKDRSLLHSHNAKSSLLDLSPAEENIPEPWS